MFFYPMYYPPSPTTPARTVPPTVYYEVSWLVKTDFGELVRIIRGTEDQVNVVAEALKDDPSIVGLNVITSSDQSLLPGGHFHEIDGVVQQHPWSQCPENPINYI